MYFLKNSFFFLIIIFLFKKYENSLTVDFKLIVKKSKKDEIKEKKVYSTSFCSSPKQTIVQIVKKLNGLAGILSERSNLAEKDVEITDSLVYVYQMIILLHEIKQLYPLLVSNKSVFYPYLLSFKEDSNLQKIFNDVFEQGKNPEMDLQSFTNNKISQFLNKKFCVLYKYLI